jgi:putative peptide zinc metalloprotease protein
VDAAGIYMTLLASGVVCIAYHHDARPVLAAIGGVLSATIWVNLWPFVRMDGYWLLSDVLGVPNLMAANREMTAYLFNAIRGSRCQRPQVLSIKPRALRALFVIYYPAFAVSVAWLLFKLARWYPPILFHSVPNLVWRVAVAYRRAGLSMDLLKAVMGLVLATLPAAGLLAYLARGLAAARRHIVSRGIAPPTEPKRHETYEKLEGQIGTEID